LIICFIASSNIVSTSKGGQSFLGGKEDLPALNKQRKLEEEYKGGYIKAYYKECHYSKGYFMAASRDDARFGIVDGRLYLSKVTVPNSDINLMDDEYESNKEVVLTLYYKNPISNLDHLFNRDMDYNVVYIKSIDFSHFNSSNIVTMWRLFATCSSLEYVNFKNFYTSKLTSMDSMFYHCAGLKSIDLSGFTGVRGQTGFRYMFSFCNLLMFVNISNLYIGGDQFRDLFCYKDAGSPRVYGGYFNLQYMNIYNTSIGKNDIYSFMDHYITNINVSAKAHFCIKDELSLYNDLTEAQMKIKGRVKKCCDYNYEKLECNVINYIIVTFNNKVQYRNGFNNSYRTDIFKIYLDGNEKKNKRSIRYKFRLRTKNIF
jgi:hypothetical protein